MINLLLTSPHSGEQIPEITSWLKKLPQNVLMCDVDRYVDQLYQPICENLGLKLISTPWHRYAVDLNRVPSDIDASSVVGAPLTSGTHPRGYHWVYTTKKETILPAPMTQEIHNQLTDLIYKPFHQQIEQSYKNFHSQNFKEIFHLDVHSMPSVGTSEHRDPGQTRAHVVVSDNHGKSSKSTFVDLVQSAYKRAGFQVAHNWPYYGGRLTEQYGNPSLGHHVVQVELNRALYMDEETKEKTTGFFETQNKLKQALEYISSQISSV